MTSKEYFLDRVVSELLAKNGGALKILEIGCGTAAYVPEILKKYPQLEYWGIEPIPASFAAAEQNLAGQTKAKVFHQLGYEKPKEIENIEFDLVISFSVLEHVKQLGKFMCMSASCVKPGGLMVHRYDLGHALYPGSFKERLHVFLGNTVPNILPETKFVRYVPRDEVAREFKKHLGTEPYQYTFHQMPNVKRLENFFQKAHNSHNTMFETIYAWEFEHAEELMKIPVAKLERIFPTVAVWGEKIQY